jgi:signal transduction histidine kinase
MKRYLDGLRLQLLGFIILPLSLILLVLAVTGVQVHQEAMRRLVAERDERSVRAAAAAISQQLHHRGAAVRSIVLRLDDGADPGTVLEQASYLRDDYDAGLAIYDHEGKLIDSVDVIQGLLDLPVNGVAREMAIDDTIFSEHYVDDDGEAIALVVARGEEHVVVGSFTISSIMRSTNLSPQSRAETYSTFLTDRSGRVLTSLGIELTDVQMSDHPGVQAALRGDTGSSYLPADDGEHVVAFSQIPQTSWALIIEEPWETVTSPVLDLSLIAPLVLVPVLGVMLIALWFGSRQIVGPLRELEQMANHLAGGDYDAVAEPVGGIAEIQHLQQTLGLMSERIQAAQNALRGYISTMTRTQEDERRRLARELHDETIQDLIALRQQAQMLEISLGDDDHVITQDLKKLHQSTQEAIDRVRRLTRGLRPIYLEDLGLVPALQMLARDTEFELGIKVLFQPDGQIQRLNPETELALYRIVQEALSNINRHANASHVLISIGFNTQTVVITVRDDGIGFQVPDQTSDLARNGHFGLIGMVERAELINARLSIQSNPEHGTEIITRLLLNNPSNTED